MFGRAFGMPLIFSGIGLIPAGTITLFTILVVLLSLALTGAMVRVIHGVVLVWLLDKQEIGTTENNHY